MKIKLIYKESDHIEYKQIETSASEIVDIKDDVKIRTEVCRELMHNAIDEKAESIEFEVGYQDTTKVTLKVSYNGCKLNAFKNIDEIIKSILKLEESSKRDDDSKIGGKGRGAKILIASGKLEIKSIYKGVCNHIRIKDPNYQVEKIAKKEKDEFEIEVIEENVKIDKNVAENQVEFTIYDLPTGGIQNWEHDALVKYIKYFTVVGKIGNKNLCDESINIKVKGLCEEKGKHKEAIYSTKSEAENIIVENIFDKIKDYADRNNLDYHYIKGDENNVDSNVNINERISDIEINMLRDFAKETNFYIFRTKDKKLKKYIKMNHDMKDGDFFGIYPASNGVMINERFSNLKTSTTKGDKSGGNLFSQYFGYFYNESFLHSGNRNYTKGTNSYIEFVDKVNKEIIVLINKVLAIINKQPKKKVNLGSDTTIQGLFGELSHIYHNPDMIKSWVSYQKLNNNKKPHDFEFNGGFAEIKTKIITKDEDQYLIHISSIKQLDDERDGELCIYYLNDFMGNSGDGDNILDLIRNLVDKLKDDEEDLQNLFTGIGNYIDNNNFRDYYNSIIWDIDTNSGKYDLDDLKRFKIVKMETYNIDKELPIIRFEYLEENCVELRDGYDLNLTKLKSKGIYPMVKEF